MSTVCALTLLVLTNQTAQTDEWKPFTSDEGRFSVKFPGVPMEKKTKTPTGQVTNAFFAGKDETAYLASFTDYSDALGVFDPQVTLKFGRDAIVRGLNAKLSVD